MYAGVMAADVYLGPSSSLKEKRSLVRPIVMGLHRRFSVAAAETGHVELLQRSEIAVSCVSNELQHCVQQLDTCEDWLRGLVHVEVLEVRRAYIGDEEMSDG